MFTTTNIILVIFKRRCHHCTEEMERGETERWDILWSGARYWRCERAVGRHAETIRRCRETNKLKGVFFLSWTKERDMMTHTQKKKKGGSFDVEIAKGEKGSGRTNKKPTQLVRTIQNVEGRKDEEKEKRFGGQRTGGRFRARGRWKITGFIQEGALSGRPAGNSMPLNNAFVAYREERRAGWIIESCERSHQSTKRFQRVLRADVVKRLWMKKI